MTVAEEISIAYCAVARMEVLSVYATPP